MASTKDHLSSSVHSAQEQQDQLNRDLEEDHRFGGTHWLPLFLVLIPSLGSLLHGDSDAWTDGLLLLLVAFFLYKSTQIPWQLYASARTTRIRANTQIPDNIDSQILIHATPDLEGYTTELERIEFFSLLLAIASPSLGVYLLFLLQARLKFDLEFLNSNAIVVFLLASLIKPLMHLHHLLLTRATYLQTKLHFPEDLITELRATASELNTRLKQLETSAVSKYELKLLKQNYMDQPITKISETLAYQSQADEKRQRQVAEESAELARALVKIESRIAATASSLNTLVEERGRIGDSPIQTLAQMVIQLIWDTKHRNAIKHKKSMTTAYLQSLPSDSSDEDGRTQLFQPREAMCQGALEFHSRQQQQALPKKHPISHLKSWVMMVFWPISIPLRIFQVTAETLYKCVWTPEIQAEFQRLSEFNHQKEQSSLPGYRLPVWPGLVPRENVDGIVKNENINWMKHGKKLAGGAKDGIHDIKDIEQE